MHRRILGYSRRESASGMFANNAIDTFDALLHKNIYGFKRHIFNINNDLIRVMYSCTRDYIRRERVRLFRTTNCNTKNGS